MLAGMKYALKGKWLFSTLTMHAGTNCGILSVAAIVIEEGGLEAMIDSVMAPTPQALSWNMDPFGTGRSKVRRYEITVSLTSP